MVVGYHAVYYLIGADATRTWIPGGFIGVDVFFVLSGFLITSLLLEERRRTGRISLSRFYARRALRLFPAVGVLLVAHLALAIASSADLGLELRTLVAVAVYALNWMIAGGHPIAAGLGHLWSLSVEEQFYLLWPLVLLGALRLHRSLQTIAGIAFLGIAVAIATRAWLWFGGADWNAIYVRTDARVDELLLGVLLALAFHLGWRPTPRWRPLAVAGLVFLICTATVYVSDSWTVVGGSLFIGIAAVLLIASLLESGSPLTRAFAWRPAVAVGRASYSLYLWHAPVFVAVADHTQGRPTILRLLIALGATACTTLFSYHVVEMPMLRLRRKTSADRAPAMSLG